jgi:polar amino acid transport system substrate-binding protein
MTISMRTDAKSAAVLAISTLALTACTNASVTDTGARSNSTSSVPAFDPTTIAKDDAMAARVPDAIKSRGTLIIGASTTYAPGEFLGGPDNRTAMG